MSYMVSSKDHPYKTLNSFLTSDPSGQLLWLICLSDSSLSESVQTPSWSLNIPSVSSKKYNIRCIHMYAGKIIMKILSKVWLGWKCILHVMCATNCCVTIISKGCCWERYLYSENFSLKHKYMYLQLLSHINWWDKNIIVNRCLLLWSIYKYGKVLPIHWKLWINLNTAHLPCLNWQHREEISYKCCCTSPQCAEIKCRTQVLLSCDSTRQGWTLVLDINTKLTASISTCFIIICKILLHFK
jgi:hypothetical protein